MILYPLFFQRRAVILAWKASETRGILIITANNIVVDLHGLGISQISTQTSEDLLKRHDDNHQDRYEPSSRISDNSTSKECIRAGYPSMMLDHGSNKGHPQGLNFPCVHDSKFFHTYSSPERRQQNYHSLRKPPASRPLALTK